MTRVIIVDDHALFRLGVKSSIESSDGKLIVAGETESGEALFHLLETVEADIVLLDIRLPDISGIEIARRLQIDHPVLKILAVSAENDAETVKAMCEVGIDGFISKRQCGSGELVNAINNIMSGLQYFGKDIAEIIYGIYVSKKKTAEVAPEFTEREREIILLCRDGLAAKQIADRLFISVNTVNNHKTNIFRKLNINSTIEMLKYAVKYNIINFE